MPSVPLLDLKAQYAPLRSALTEAVTRVVESQYFILGPEVEALEREVATYTGAKHAIGCASGTDALVLSLAALDLEPEDEVITTPFSFFSTASCAYKVGARPAFADIDPRTFNLDPERAEDAITERTRVLLPVHLFGQSAEMDGLLDIARRRELPLIEDAAQALGASFRPRAATSPLRCGTMGRFGCYSFFPTKNLGCFGDGGMIVTSDDALAERVRVLRVHGGRQMYHHRWVGWNSRLDALQAAVLRVKLPHLDAWSAGRARNADRYDRMLTEAGLVEAGRVTLPYRGPGRDHIFNQYTLRVERRDELKAHLDASGIGNSIYYPVALHLQDCFRELGYGEGDFPHAEQACREVISLPVYPEIESAQLEAVVGRIVEFYRG
ncbi:MAG TPA: DegT/DnrJ/EryC1/StrS family aminotransferase [Candidatus Polarisedimenticolaceae bacterium]|nr:DegT/DnrJ/EryC1/StrS family aminotransferase [Candidatus Polarisedimenticolaceae bacterium]